MISTKEKPQAVATAHGPKPHLQSQPNSSAEVSQSQSAKRIEVRNNS